MRIKMCNTLHQCMEKHSDCWASWLCCQYIGVKLWWQESCSPLQTTWHCSTVRRYSSRSSGRSLWSRSKESPSEYENMNDSKWYIEKKKKVVFLLSLTQTRNLHIPVTMRLKFRWFRNSDDSEKWQNKNCIMMQFLMGCYSFQKTWIYLEHEADRGFLSHFVLSAVFNVWSPTYFTVCYSGLF